MSDRIQKIIAQQDAGLAEQRRVDSPILHYTADTTPEDLLPVELSEINAGERVVESIEGKQVKKSIKLKIIRTPEGVRLVDQNPSTTELLSILPESLLTKLARG